MSPMPMDVTSPIEPLDFKLYRDTIKKIIPGVIDATDQRRGFVQLHWTPNRPWNVNNPAELSLECEGRLRPRTEDSLARLQQALADSLLQPIRRFLLKDDDRFGDLTVARYDRPTGPQSIDHYYDNIAEDQDRRLIPRMMTFRKRVKAGTFMTWNSDAGAKVTSGPQPSPLNFELPFKAIGTHGVTTRLEFNWIDAIEQSVSDFNRAVGLDAAPDELIRNPLYLASRYLSFDGGEFQAVTEHTTFREKFSILRPSEGTAPATEMFQVNLDHVTAQDLRTKRVGNYVDIDISAVELVDAAVLTLLDDFSGRLSRAYDLAPLHCTKSWRDLMVTGGVTK